MRSRTRTEQCWENCLARIIPVTLLPAPLFPRMQTCLRNALRGISMLCRSSAPTLGETNPSPEAMAFPRVIMGSGEGLARPWNNLFAFARDLMEFFTLVSPPSCISMWHSGQTSFLNSLPTLSLGQLSHQIFLQVGHCQRGGLKKPPICFLHLEQNPLTSAPTRQ